MAQCGRVDYVKAHVRIALGLRGRHAAFLLLQDPEDLLFVEPAPLHIVRILSSDSTRKRSHFRGARQQGCLNERPLRRFFGPSPNSPRRPTYPPIARPGATRALFKRARRLSIGTSVQRPTLTVSRSPDAMSSYNFDRPIPVIRTASGIRTARGSALFDRHALGAEANGRLSC